MITFLLWTAALAFAQSPQYLEQGAYLVRAAECRACHTASEAQPFAGGYRLETPFGAFYTPNITPDSETGIGTWDFTQFRRALRHGVSPQGSIYYPTFPYRSFTKIRDSDMEKMFFYLRAQPAIHKVNRPHELFFPYGQRWLLMGWQELFFRGPKSSLEENLKIGMGPFVPVPDHSPTWNRGAYLVEGLLHCAECHTPRNSLGAPIAGQWLAGSNILVGGKKPPNITPDSETGLKWSAQDWTLFLAAGLTPQNTTPKGEMALVVQATSQLSKEDRAAVVEYLMSQRPVRSSDE